MSRKKARPAKKAPPIKLSWLEQVIAHQWPDKPQRNSIIATAAVLAGYASLDGRDVFPTIKTAAREAGIKPATVIACIRAMRTAGMLEASGKAYSGANRYTLCLIAVPDETLPEVERIAPGVAPSVAPRGTQPPTLDRKGEGGGDAPAAATPSARGAGINTGDTKTIEPAVSIEGDHANRIIADFITAFDATFAKRKRSSTTDIRHLEPSHRELRTAIITKIDAGWPLGHLIDRITADLPDVRTIKTLNGIINKKLRELPDRPDHTAHAFMVEVEATRKIEDAARLIDGERLDDAEREARDRRRQALNDYRRAVRKYCPTLDADFETKKLEMDLDAEAEAQDHAATWPPGLWVWLVHEEIAALKDEHQPQALATKDAR